MALQLTPTGIEVWTQPEIIALMEESLRSVFGDINTAADSVNGQLLGVYSKPAIDISELIEEVYLSMSPNDAEGKKLDDILLLTGLTRLPALPTAVNIGVKGTTGTIVPQGNTTTSDAPNNDDFITVSENTITPMGRLSIYVKVDAYVDSTAYEITINSTTYSVNSGSSSDVQTVAGLLKDEINNDMSAEVTAEIVGDNLDVIKIVTKSTAFDTSINSNMSIWNIFIYNSSDVGPIPAVKGTITTITTPVTGMDEIENFEDGITGRPIESDVDARLRRLESLQILGAGTLPAMVARMQRDVEGVTAVKGYENRDDIIDGDGRPPHSTELVISGGDPQDIADQIWLTKPGGIETFGNTSQNTIDGNGDPQTMNWTIPEPKYAHIRATITQNNEKTFPTNGLVLIANAILEYGNTFLPGDDVIRDLFYVPVASVGGIETIMIEMDVTNNIGDTPSWSSTARITITPQEIATFDISNIVVIDNTP